MAMAIFNRKSVQELVLALMGAYAKIGHKHDAEDIDRGVLPIERGGTDAQDPVSAREKLGAADVIHSHGEATRSENGFMSSSDWEKLQGIEAGANDYSHPERPGSLHIPAGGRPGQFLKWASEGAAEWAEDNDTVYEHPIGPGSNHVPSGGSTGQMLLWSADGAAEWSSCPTYGLATQSENGLMSSADKRKLDGSYPKGIAIFSYDDLNPAELYGGTWTVRTDTHMFLGLRVYRRVQ